MDASRPPPGTRDRAGGLPGAAPLDVGDSHSLNLKWIFDPPRGKSLDSHYPVRYFLIRRIRR